MTEPSIVYEDDVFCFARNGRLLVHHYNGPPSVATLRRIRELQFPIADEIAEADGKKGPRIATAAVLRSDRGLMVGADVRQESAVLQRDIEVHQLAIANFVLERGLKATAARGLIGAISMISGLSYPVRVFGAVAEGADWVCQTHPELDPRAAQSAIEWVLRHRRHQPA